MRKSANENYLLLKSGININILEYLDRVYKTPLLIGIPYKPSYLTTVEAVDNLPMQQESLKLYARLTRTDRTSVTNHMQSL
jgi:hypothetical protein